MIEVLEGAYTIIRFVDVGEGGKIYRGESLIDELGVSSLYGYEKALKELQKDYRSVRFVAKNWESMADLAFGQEWNDRTLSEITTEAELRGLEIKVWESNGKSNA